MSIARRILAIVILFGIIYLWNKYAAGFIFKSKGISRIAKWFYWLAFVLLSYVVWTGGM